MRIGAGWCLSGEEEWVVVDSAGEIGEAFLSAAAAATASSKEGGG
jgi:hypothetical protein